MDSTTAQRVSSNSLTVSLKAFPDLSRDSRPHLRDVALMRLQYVSRNIYPFMRLAPVTERIVSKVQVYSLKRSNLTVVIADKLRDVVRNMCGCSP